MVRFIPAIDIIDGKCVRLTQGDYSQKKIYNENPVEVAKSFENAGLQYLHLVDLDGAKQKKVVNYKVLEQIASQTSLKIDFGGGVQSNEDIQKVFDAGAKQITGGSIAVKNPDLFESWIERYGSEKIILGADVKNEKIAVGGWEETSELHIFDFLEKYLAKGIRYVICTDISKDGLLQGTSLELYQKILKKFPDIHLIASGGVSCMQDLDDLQKNGLEGAIIGKAIYEEKISLEELTKEYSK
ncbi:1-(5-phosphoribosyl)-5-[(5-phosphoribosylamino)methylideneamino] imidazole-4-carboxamide isomerase [bacterium 336/3]|nr:1-(5-phosphoribosyl)-5-[(5-phosphoribosylamino)methylideneamino] imidazole-4-carboxamide isomerase [bacterium 336/3]